MTHIESLFEIQKLADDFMRSPTADTSETGMARLIGQIARIADNAINQTRCDKCSVGKKEAACPTK